MIKNNKKRNKIKKIEKKVGPGWVGGGGGGIQGQNVNQFLFSISKNNYVN